MYIVHTRTLYSRSAVKAIERKTKHEDTPVIPAVKSFHFFF